MAGVADLPDEIRAELEQDPASQEVGDPNMLAAIGVLIAGKRDEAKAARTSSAIESVWLEAEEAYIGMDDANRDEFAQGKWSKPSDMSGPVTTSRGPGTDTTKSSAFVRLTARYVDAGAAKLGEILLPLDDKAFSITETPDPELIAGKDDKRQLVDEQTGQPMMRNAQPGELPQTGGGALPGATPSAPTPASPVPPVPPAGMPAAAPTAMAPTPPAVPDGTPPLPAGAAGAAPAQPPQVPLTAADLAEEKIELARKKATAAETKIYDWLVESHYQAEMRKVIFDAARIGVGILKGPFPKADTAMAISKDDTGAIVLEINEKLSPAVKQVDPWNIFPDPACGEMILDGDYIFERDQMSRRQVMKLKSQPGYIASAIDQVLEEGPQTSMSGWTGSSSPSQRNDEAGKKDRFEIWYFNGEIKREEMDAIRSAGAMKIKPAKPTDPDTVHAIVSLINMTVVKAVFNPLEGSGDFPYHAFPWQRRPGHWAGIGVSEQIRMPQRTVNAATRALLNNAGLSGGVQIVLDQAKIRPANTEWFVTPDKIWYWQGESDMGDVRNAFAVFEIPNVTAQMMQIIEYGMKLGEESTSIPLITQGQTGPTTPETLGATQLQNSNANQLLRSIGYAMDDYITEPLIRQFYEYLLLDPNVPDDAKGDFKINAHGSIALVEQAIQDQYLVQLQAVAANPAEANVLGLDPRKVQRLILKSKRMDPELVMRTEEELARLDAAPPPQAPAVQVATINAEVAEKKIAQDAQTASAEQQVEMHDITANAQVDLQKIMVNRELQLLLYANQNNQTLQTVQAELAQTAMKLNVQKDLALADHVMDHHQHSTLSADSKLSATSTMPPPVQVPGRAGNGQAFEQTPAGNA